MADQHFTHPVATVEELSHRRHIAKCFRSKNHPAGVELGDRVVDTQPTSAGFVEPLARTVLGHLEEVGAFEGLTEDGTFVDAVPIQPLFCRAIALREAHALSWEELEKRLKAHPEIAALVGYDSVEDVHSGNYFGSKARETESAAVVTETGAGSQRVRTAIENAARRCVWAAVRVGAPLPVATVTEYDIDLSWPVDETTIPQKTKRYALWNWIDKIVEAVIADVDFGRAANTTYPVKAFFGVLAHSAVTGIGVRSVATTLPIGCKYRGPTNINYTLDKLSKDDVQAEFENALDSFLTLVSDTDLIGDSHEVAFDPTLIPSPTTDSRLTVGSGSGQFWFYPVASLVDPGSRLVLELRQIQKKSHQSDKLLQFINNIQNFIGVDRLYLDGDFHQAEVIDHCEEFDNVNWIIRCNPGRLKPEYRPRYNGVILEPYHDAHWLEDISVGDETCNLVWYKIRTKDGTKQYGYLTDMTADDCDASTIHKRYKRRCGIETTFGQLKTHFRAATEPEEASTELVYMHAAILFYNIYILVNEYYSPNLLLRLDASPDQVLVAIRDVCLECATNPIATV